MEKFSQQREMRIAQQEKEKETLNVLNSFQNDPSPLNLAAKPRSKEERRNSMLANLISGPTTRWPFIF